MAGFNRGVRLVLAAANGDFAFESGAFHRRGDRILE